MDASTPSDPPDGGASPGEDAPVGILETVRARHPSSGRSRTIPNSVKLSPAELRQRGRYPEELATDRPRHRGGCNETGAVRPCPYVSCSAHLYLDVDPETGALKLNFPLLEVWEMKFSCSLDEADASLGEGMTLEEVAERTNLTRERVRQLEDRVKKSAKKAAVRLTEGVPLVKLRVIR